MSYSRALAALALSMLLSSVGVSIPNVALPTLARAFSSSLPEVQWVITAYLLAVTALIVGIGALGDALGRKKVLLVGISVFTFSAALCAFAPTLGFLIAARALQGIGAAALMGLTVASVNEVTPRSRLGRAMGLLGTMSAVGTAAGPSLGGLLVAWLGWRSVFLAMIPLGALAFVLAYRHVPASGPASEKEQGARPLDFGGLFPGLAGSLAMNSLVSAVMMSTLVVGPFYLSRTLNLPPAIVGLVMSVGPLTSALTGHLAGRFVDRFGARNATIAGLIEVGVGAVAMAWLPRYLGVSGYVISAVLLSPGYQAFQAANQAEVMSKAPLERRGVASGLLSLSRNLGLTAGASVMGIVFHRNGMTVTFSLAAVLTTVALSIALVGKSGRARELPEFAARALLIGSGATLFIDAWAFLLRQFGIRSLDFAYLGRWIGHLSRGRWFHESIAASTPIPGELWIGWIAHYSIGIVFATLLVSLFGLRWARAPSLYPALLVGVATVVAPWFVLQPALGLGSAYLKSLVTHTVYGIGLYLAARLAAHLSRSSVTSHRTRP